MGRCVRITHAGLPARLQQRWLSCNERTVPKVSWTLLVPVSMGGTVHVWLHTWHAVAGRGPGATAWQGPARPWRQSAVRVSRGAFWQGMRSVALRSCPCIASHSQSCICMVQQIEIEHSLVLLFMIGLLPVLDDGHGQLLRAHGVHDLRLLLEAALSNGRKPRPWGLVMLGGGTEGGPHATSFARGFVSE
jgi:hypothetical protein